MFSSVIEYELFEQRKTGAEYGATDRGFFAVLMSLSLVAGPALAGSVVPATTQPQTETLDTDVRDQRAGQLSEQLTDTESLDENSAGSAVTGLAGNSTESRPQLASEPFDQTESLHNGDRQTATERLVEARAAVASLDPESNRAQSLQDRTLADLNQSLSSYGETAVVTSWETFYTQKAALASLDELSETPVDQAVLEQAQDEILAASNQSARLSTKHASNLVRAYEDELTANERSMATRAVDSATDELRWGEMSSGGEDTVEHYQRAWEHAQMALDALNRSDNTPQSVTVVETAGTDAVVLLDRVSETNVETLLEALSRADDPATLADRLAKLDEQTLRTVTEKRLLEETAALIDQTPKGATLLSEMSPEGTAKFLQINLEGAEQVDGNDAATEMRETLTDVVYQTGRMTPEDVARFSKEVRYLERNDYEGLSQALKSRIAENPASQFPQSIKGVIYEVHVAAEYVEEPENLRSSGLRSQQLADEFANITTGDSPFGNVSDIKSEIDWSNLWGSEPPEQFITEVLTESNGIELDVLQNKNGSLVYLEAKSGSISTKNDIYKKLVRIEAIKLLNESALAENGLEGWDDSLQMKVLSIRSSLGSESADGATEIAEAT